MIVPVGVSQGTIKRSHCTGNEEDKLEQREKNDTDLRRNILMYYCVYLIPICLLFCS